MNKTDIAKRLTKLRIAKDITQQKVADDIGLKQSTYAMYESAQRIPSDENKRKLAAYYHTTVQELFYA